MTQTPETPGPDPTPEPVATPPAATAPTAPAPAAPEATTAPPPGYAAPAAPASGGGGNLLGSPLAIALCVIGAVLVVASIFLNWADVSISANGATQTFTANSREVPIQFLWDNTTSSEDPSLLIALLPAAVFILVGIVYKVRWLAVLGGLVAIGVAGLFTYQVNDGIDRLPPQIQSIFDFIGIAPWFAFVGGIFGVVGGLLPRRSSSA
jgi:hypothetical protein